MLAAIVAGWKGYDKHPGQRRNGWFTLHLSALSKITGLSWVLTKQEHRKVFNTMRETPRADWANQRKMGLNSPLSCMPVYLAALRNIHTSTSRTSKSPGDLLKHRSLGASWSDSAGLGWSLRICISNRIPSEAETTLWVALTYNL